MARPVIFTIDDDPEVLRAIEHDLRRHYGNTFRVLRANSGAMALETLKQLKLRNEVVALFVVDQRMPKMSGTDFLTEAIKLFPAAKRVLLTAYADTEAAIKAINTTRVDYYLVKPWSPPEQDLYPVLDDLIAERGEQRRASSRAVARPLHCCSAAYSRLLQSRCHSTGVALTDVVPAECTAMSHRNWPEP